MSAPPQLSTFAHTMRYTSEMLFPSSFWEGRSPLFHECALSK